MKNNAPETCDVETCPACNEPTDMNWRRAIGLMENHFIERGKLGSYSEKLSLVKAMVATASA